MGLRTDPAALDTPRRRLARAGITLFVLAALVSPAIRNVDDFPLSTYPMYATARGEITQFTLAVGLDDEGARSRLSLDLIGASDDPLIVAGELRAAVRAGRADQRCSAIAERVAMAGTHEITTIEIVSERHRTVDATLGQESLVDRDILAACAVSPP